MNFLPVSIADYAEMHTSPESPMLQSLERETHLKMLRPGMLSGKLQGRLLSMFSYMLRPSAILEIGTFTGYSALCLAEGLAENGILDTIEANEEYEPVIRKYIAAAGLENKIRLHIGDALKIIPTLKKTFDLVFIDAGKRDYPQYYDQVFGKVRPGGFIIADNVLWKGKVTEDNQDVDTAILNGFNKRMLNDPRVENILLPLRDGLMVARKL